jgi:uncharacterized protein (TIGR03083 family)
VAAWASASADFIDLVTPLSQAEWDTPTALPGWTVGDIVAHVSWIERILLGEYDEPYEPDWDSLPHATSFFGRITEVPVDLRRSWTREDVLIELADVIARRTLDIDQGPEDLDAEVAGPFGPAPLGRVLRMRTLDTWVHEQDIREALGRPGHLDSLGAQGTAAQLLMGYPKVWGKSVGAAPGETLRLRVTGPGIEQSRLIAVGDGGRAYGTPDAPGATVDEATVTLTMSWPVFLALSCGRGDVSAARAQVAVEGDEQRGNATLDNFCVMI